VPVPLARKDELGEVQPDGASALRADAGEAVMETDKVRERGQSNSKGIRTKLDATGVYSTFWICSRICSISTLSSTA
jgi:hypothetical protein